MSDRQRLRARPRLALWLAAIDAVVMLPLLLSAPLELRTGQLVLLAAALALGLVAYLNQAALGDRIHFDALAGLVLILLATAGPLPAFGLLAFGDLLYRLLERPRAMAQLANLASYGWGLLAATGVLGLLGYPAGAGVSTLAGAAALAVAGSACVTVNYCVTRGLVAVVADGQPAVATFRREFVPMLPAQVTVVAVGAVSATLGAWVGVLGLLPIVVAVIAPQTMLALLTRLAPAPATLRREDARGIYVRALADAAGLSRRMRRQLITLSAVGGVLQPAGFAPWRTPLRHPKVHHLRQEPARVRGPLPTRLTRRRRPLRAHDTHDMFALVLTADERWDGQGWPGVLHGQRIPIQSRILAVADEWAKLTCADGQQLDQPAALDQLALAADRVLDPAVVHLAYQVIATEPRLCDSTEAVPVLHRLPQLPILSRPMAARVLSAIR